MDVFKSLNKDEVQSSPPFPKVESDLYQEATPEVYEILQAISDSQIPVHLTLDSPSIEFRSILWFKDQHVLLLKPEHVGPHINFDSILYLDWVEEKEKEHQVIALTVSHPHIPINDCQSGMICEISKTFQHVSFRQRLQNRYDVSARNDCHLKIPGKTLRFRVLDISPGGLRFEILPNQQHMFQPNQHYPSFQLETTNLKIKYKDLWVQDLHGTSVSCRMGLKGHTQEEMNILIEFLKQKKS